MADLRVVLGQWREPARVLGALAGPGAPSRLAEPARLAARLAEAADALAAGLEPDAGPVDVRALRQPIGEATVAVHEVFAAAGLAP